MSFKKLKLKAEGQTQQRILDYLIENASEALTAKINTGKKTLSGCMGFLQSEARKMLSGNSGCVAVDDATVFGWVIHYFEEDSVKEAAKKSAVKVPGKVKAKAKPKKTKKPDPEKPAGPIVFDLFTGEAVSAVGR